MGVVRIGGGQGFYGDGVQPVGDVLEAGVDYLVCEALAELTLAILQKDRQRDESLGFTRDLPLYVRSAIPYLVDGRTKLITNAGGINPVAAGRAVVDTLKAAGVAGLTVATVVGDDVRPLADELSLPDDTLFANVYLGARPDRGGPRRRRRRRRHRPGRRRLAVRRPARPRARLGVGRLGPAVGRGGRRAPPRVLRLGGRRQLLRDVVGEPRPAARRLPDRRGRRGRHRRHHQVAGGGRHGHVRHRPRAAALRGARPGRLPQPRRHGRLHLPHPHRPRPRPGPGERDAWRVPRRPPTRGWCAARPAGPARRPSPTRGPTPKPRPEPRWRGCGDGPSRRASPVDEWCEEYFGVERLPRPGRRGGPRRRWRPPASSRPR